MMKPMKLVFFLCLLWGVQTQALAQEPHRETRGELLYSTHCNACHTSKIHWREHKLATDWDSLEAQVRRWQASIGLGWSEEEIADVTRYLNDVYYSFSNTP
jgi:mono/diheme cytochrome c family protein